MAAMDHGIGPPGGTLERPAVFFRDAAEFGRWLQTHHDSETELWMELRRKHVPERGLTWEAAVREALCWGWIDSRVERVDADRTRQRWTPRRRGSIWSVVNINAVQELLAEGRMQPSGIAAWEARREDRSGIYSFEGDGVELTDAFAARLEADPAASAFWAEATRSYRRLVTHWVMTAKQEATRERRMAQLLECSAAGQLIPNQRYGIPPTWVARAAAAAEAARR